MLGRPGVECILLRESVTAGLCYPWDAVASATTLKKACIRPSTTIDFGALAGWSEGK